MEPEEYLAFRKANKMTQQQAADYFGMSLKTYRKKEKGYREKPYPKDTIMFDGKDAWVGGHKGTRAKAGYIRKPSDYQGEGFSYLSFFGKPFLWVFGVLLVFGIIGSLFGPSR